MTSPILIVEDETILLIDLQAGLEDGGYTVLAAQDGEEALSVIAAEGGQIRVLVTDIDLGRSGVNGWDIAERAREGQPDLPVIYMTGASADEWASRGVPRSILLPKPFAMAQITSAVSRLLNESPEPPAQT
jgi:DNA-binding NtrC family response regulator